MRIGQRETTFKLTARGVVYGDGPAHVDERGAFEGNGDDAVRCCCEHPWQKTNGERHLAIMIIGDCASPAAECRR